MDDAFRPARRGDDADGSAVFYAAAGIEVFELGKDVSRPGGTRRFNCNIGVSPTNWVMSSATRRWDISEVFESTLQGKGKGVRSSIGGILQVF